MRAHAALVLSLLYLHHTVLVGRLLAPHTAIVGQSRPVPAWSEASTGRGSEEGGKERGRGFQWRARGKYLLKIHSVVEVVL